MKITAVGQGRLAILAFVTLCACSSGEAGKDTGASTDALDVRAEARADTQGEYKEPVGDPEAAARAFRLYYRERVERVIISYNRFMLFGDVTFGTTIGKAGVAREGDQWEIAVGPNDNNKIGVSTWNTLHAYRTFRTRLLALSLIRMFEGLVFFEAVSGHPGVTSRMVYPGWTLTVDGTSGAIERWREGEIVEPPNPPDPALESEIMAAFFKDFRATYRMHPEDLLLAYMPVKEVGPYAVTYSFSMLPDYLRVSDCCTSLKRTPAPFPWEGAFWGNHNSRDNFPDLAMGYLAARAVLDDPEADADLRAAAARAWESGQRTGDHIQAHEGRLMTVDEHNPYDTLVVAGGIRPDGETEAEDLGSLSDCQMVFLARALSTEGLSLPLPELPAPGSLEHLLADFLADQCPIPEPVRKCAGMGEAYCGKDWSNIGELQFLGKPWLEVVEELEAETPGSAESLIGSFQDDFYEKNIAMLGLVFYATTTGDEALRGAALAAQGELTDLMRYFAELLYAQTQPDRLAERLYEAALFDAKGGREVVLAELNDFARAEYQMGLMEGLPDLEDSSPDPLLTDDEIKAVIDKRLAGASNSARQRYLDHYGDTPPLRRTETGYEARGYHPDQGLWPWQAVENSRHHDLGGIKLFEALPLCETAPNLLDCTWARLGCARPDLNNDREVDETDIGIFTERTATFKSVPCGTANDWCDRADLDHTGAVDDIDTAFMTAAQGCWY